MNNPEGENGYKVECVDNLEQKKPRATFAKTSYLRQDLHPPPSTLASYLCQDLHPGLAQAQKTGQAQPPDRHRRVETAASQRDADPSKELREARRRPVARMWFLQSVE